MSARRHGCAHQSERKCDACALAARRRAGRECTQRKRDREFAKRLIGARRCPRREGRFGTCGGVLDTRIGPRGETVIHCPRCQRRKLGICRDCPAPVAGERGKALRCARCKLKAIRAAQRKSVKVHHEERLQRAREYYQRNPERRARRNDYKKLYRQANPDQVKKEKYRAGVRGGKARERHLRYHRRYNARKARQEKKRAQALLAYYERHPDRPTARCQACSGYLNWAPGPGKGRPPAWCDQHAPASEKARRKKLGRSYIVVDAPPPPEAVPLTILRKAQAARDGRRCLTPGCGAPVAGRRKKCDACLSAAAELARQKLAEHQGRGRRTDLEQQGAA